jgi:hypothetical protein
VVGIAEPLVSLGVNDFQELIDSANNQFLITQNMLKGKFRTTWREEHIHALNCLHMCRVYTLLNTPPSRNITPEIARLIFTTSKGCTLTDQRQIPRDPASVTGLISAIRKNTEHEQTSSAPSLQHNQGDQPVHEAQSQSHCSHPQQRHPITGRRLHTPPQSLTTAVTTLPATTTQRVTRSRTLCTTLQLQNSADPMDTDATNQTTRAEVMQEHRYNYRQPNARYQKTQDTEPNRTPHFPSAKHTCHRG